MTAHVLTVVVPKRLWFSSNRMPRVHAHRQNIVRDLQQLAAEQAMIQRLKPLTGPYYADWVISYPKGVRTDKGDPANAHPVCKALLDGLVPRWLQDDGPLHVVRESYARGPNLNRPADHEIQLTLTPKEVTE